MVKIKLSKPLRGVKKKSGQNYQDYVIRDGRLIGDWEGLYKNFVDPWNQSRSDQLLDSRRMVALNWCCRLRDDYQVSRVLEVGCGFGHLTDALREKGLSSIGTDISRTAVAKARQLHPASVFFEAAITDFSVVAKFDADVYLLSEVTWYILDGLDGFLANLKKQSRVRRKPVFLIHLLSIYAPGVQKYGSEKFTTLDEILAYFNLEYLESGLVRSSRQDDRDARGTYFIARI